MWGRYMDGTSKENLPAKNAQHELVTLRHPIISPLVPKHKLPPNIKVEEPDATDTATHEAGGYTSMTTCLLTTWHWVSILLERT